MFLLVKLCLFSCHCFASPFASGFPFPLPNSISAAAIAASSSLPSFSPPSAVVLYFLYSGPRGIPAGLTRMRPATRSGYRTA